MTPGDSHERPAQRQACVLLGLSEEAADAMLANLAQDFHPISQQMLDDLLGPCGFSACVEYFRALGFAAFVTTRIRGTAAADCRA